MGETVVTNTLKTRPTMGVRDALVALAKAYEKTLGPVPYDQANAIYQEVAVSVDELMIAAFPNKFRKRVDFRGGGRVECIHE